MIVSVGTIFISIYQIKIEKFSFIWFDNKIVNQNQQAVLALLAFLSLYTLGYFFGQLLRDLKSFSYRNFDKNSETANRYVKALSGDLEKDEVKQDLQDQRIKKSIDTENIHAATPYRVFSVLVEIGLPIFLGIIAVDIRWLDFLELISRFLKFI